MTLNEILSLPAGSETDGLIDEVVFGIERRALTASDRHFAIKQSYVRTDYPNSQAAVDVFRWGGQEYQLQRWPVQDGEADDPAKQESWVWHGRVGKPWQEALEKYVADFRMPPSGDWTTDLVAAFAQLEKYQQPRVEWNDSGCFWGVTLNTKVSSRYDARCGDEDDDPEGSAAVALAIWRAVLADTLLKKSSSSASVTPP